MPEPVWEIDSGPDQGVSAGYDATFWRWMLRHRETRMMSSVLVKVSGTAMTVDPNTLPRTTREARKTLGRSVVEDVLHWWQPPRLLELHTHTEEPVAVGGSVDEIHEGDEIQRRIADITQWFAQRSIRLVFHNPQPDEWVAVIVPLALRVGATDAGWGNTKLTAAEEAQRLVLHKEKTGEFLGGEDITDSTVRDEVVIQAPPASVTFSAVPPTIAISTRSRKREEEFPALESDEIEQERDRLHRIATDFGWQISFTSEPDGSWFWIVLDMETGEPIKGALADNWDDAVLGAMAELKPPSGEP